MPHEITFLSAEFVKEHSNLLLAAVKFYAKQHGKTISDSTLRVLNDLTNRIESLDTIEWDARQLLPSVVAEFEADLKRQYNEPDLLRGERGRIKEWLDELSDLDFRADVFGERA